MNRKLFRQMAAFGLFAALTWGGALPARATVINSLPFPGTPDWTDVIFAGTSMTTNGTSSTLTTAQSRGVWFGNFAGANPPAWSIGNSAAGNQLAMTARFSANARDWSAYLYDGSHFAFIEFASTAATGCNVNSGACYTATPESGVRVHYAGGQPNTFDSSFFALDLTVDHLYEFLLKDGLVSYRIDNQQVYAGAASASASQKLLVIGDGSGSTLTGLGAMTISGVAIDTAPTANVVVNAVPLPAAWALLLPLVLLGGRRRT